MHFCPNGFFFCCPLGFIKTILCPLDIFLSWSSAFIKTTFCPVNLTVVEVVEDERIFAGSDGILSEI